MSHSSDKPLRILHVVDSLEYGGLERLVLDLTTAQLKQGHQVKVFSILHTGGYCKDVEAAGVPVIQGDKSRGFDLTVLKKLRAASVGADCDVVHAHNFVPTYYSATAMLACGPRKPTLVSTCHDMGGRLSNRRLRWIYGWALGRTARISMVSQGVHDQYLSSGLVNPNKTQTIINSVDVERFRNTPERRQHARRTLGLADDELVIGNVARLVDFKNHRMLIDVVPELVKTFPKLKVVIIGYGELEGTLREQVRQMGLEQHVLLTGKRSDVADMLPGFDVYCVPSLTEGLPIALLEACASALPVVATNVGGNAEVIHDQENGLVIPAGNADALRSALATLLASASLRDSYAKAADQWVRTHASIDVLYRAYDRFYRQAMGPGRERGIPS